MIFRAIIFDLDGTLLNTLDDIADAMNFVLRKYQLPTHDPEQYKYYVGDGIYNLVKRSLPNEIRERDISTYVSDMRNVYSQYLNKKTKPYEGIIPLLDRLEKIKIPKAILSNKPHELTNETVNHYFSNYKFYPVYGAREDIPIKPNSAGAVEISEKLGVPPHSCLYVGDTRTDMLTAQSAEMFSVGVTWGFRSVEELLLNGAIYVIDKPLELLDLLE